jgi:hypothetical protein
MVALVGSASAEIRYDRKLEAAVKVRVAARIGDLRTGFDYLQPIEFVRLPEPSADLITTGSIASMPMPADDPLVIRDTLQTESLNNVARRVF